MGATLPPGPDPMTAPTTPPPRRPLATFLRASVDAPPRDPMPPEEAASVTHDALPDAWNAPVPDAAEPVSVFDPPPEERDVRDRAMAALLPRSATASTATAADDSAYADQSDTVPASGSAAEDAVDHANAIDAAAAADAPVSAARSSGAPSFMRLPAARLHTPRWQWGVLAGLVLLLVVQIAVADRARLAADAGNRPWIAGLCRVLGCTLPAWQEPAAIRMLSRDVRPLPGQPGALQVQASFRNDARWAQAWPALRLSLSDADGRVIGTGVFAPHQYLDRSVDVNSVLEPGQSAQIAFRVREPAASTVAFTFEFQ